VPGSFGNIDQRILGRLEGETLPLHCRISSVTIFSFSAISRNYVIAGSKLSRCAWRTYRVVCIYPAFDSSAEGR
jgi:hypothetical protein